MLKDYLNQTEIWKHKTGINAYNEPLYASDKDIKCRKQDKIRLVRDKTGKEVVSNSTVYTLESVEVDDLISNRVVIAVNPMTSLDGITEGFEVLLI